MFPFRPIDGEWKYNGVSSLENECVNVLGLLIIGVLGVAFELTLTLVQVPTWWVIVLALFQGFDVGICRFIGEH